MPPSSLCGSESQLTGSPSDLKSIGEKKKKSNFSTAWTGLQPNFFLGTLQLKAGFYFPCSIENPLFSPDYQPTLVYFPDSRLFCVVVG